MIFFSKEAEDSVDKLLYYPYTIGKHIERAASDVNNIMRALSALPTVISGAITRRTIPNIGTITYLSSPTGNYIREIRWSSVLTIFYYNKSNFITFSHRGNIPSVHPAFYIVRKEPFFACDNGYKVVSRKYRGRDIFNFMDLNGRIISDIDFTQVKPFYEYKDMTARGYTPNRRCYIVFEDGTREEVNESKNVISGEKVFLTETDLRYIITEAVSRIVKEYEPWNNGNYFRGGGITDWEREELKKSYHYYLSQTNDEYPTMFTFNNWITTKEGEATEKGLGTQWPTYYPKFSNS